jgi:Protein of unknown function (DUF3277)
MATYSFLDVNASIDGVGGNFQLGSGAGSADEGIVVSQTEDKSTMVIGADGTPMHSLHGSTAAKVTVKLLKTSPVNAQLMSMFNTQTTSSANHGDNVITITNAVTGEVVSLGKVAFKKAPDMTYGKEAGTIEWAFDAGYTDYQLGTY